jgi:cysteine synthase B
MTLVESSSGNTGIGLAMAAAVKGYPCVITMAKKASRERRQTIRAFGAEFVLVDGGSDEAWDTGRRHRRGRPVEVLPDPSIPHGGERPDARRNAPARDLGADRRKIDVFVATLGTTGTIVGCSKYFRAKNPKIRIVSVEPTPTNEQEGHPEHHRAAHAGDLGSERRG